MTECIMGEIAASKLAEVGVVESISTTPVTSMALDSSKAAITRKEARKSENGNRGRFMVDGSASNLSFGNSGDLIQEGRCSKSISLCVHDFRCSIYESSEVPTLGENFADTVQVFDFGSSFQDDDDERYYEIKTPTHLRERSDVQKKKPSDAELEDFFAEANKKCKTTEKEMSEKYNFDFEKCVPLEGRLEWFPMKQEELRRPLSN